MPWDDGSDSVENALARVDVFFEFLEKMGIEYYCWHDRDIAPELNDLSASNDALDQVVAKLKSKQEETGVKLLWGTACQVIANTVKGTEWYAFDVGGDANTLKGNVSIQNQKCDLFDHESKGQTTNIYIDNFFAEECYGT